jgi:hypothetical protein
MLWTITKLDLSSKILNMMFLNAKQCVYDILSAFLCFYKRAETKEKKPVEKQTLTIFME